ncbi:MAG: hypothetical protein NZ602_02620 [Thermoguttaceae bacterium]|nr:hypothetical protein [Thermoguttaceae bacterium]MDW8038089.1 hypothetical protein [Thermoguttaceae bacterium]
MGQQDQLLRGSFPEPEQQEACPGERFPRCSIRLATEPVELQSPLVHKWEAEQGRDPLQIVGFSQLMGVSE